LLSGSTFSPMSPAASVGAMLKGKWALVTGASGGLGFAIAESLAGAGANIVLHDLAEPLEARDRIRSRFGAEAIAAAADLTQRPAIEAMMAELLARTGTISIAVNNAVIRHFAPLEMFAPERWEEALAVNLSAPFHITRLALPGMKQQGWGRIVNMASIYSGRATANRVDYVTTKTAILGFTRAAAAETARTGVTCNALCPGTVLTPGIEARIEAMAKNQNVSTEEAARSYLSERQPSGRFVPAQNVGALVVFLCSAAASDITGAALPIDGGWSALD
jgi:3-hydroxybutyrate dehydrogenase